MIYEQVTIVLANSSSLTQALIRDVIQLVLHRLDFPAVLGKHELECPDFVLDDFVFAQC